MVCQSRQVETAATIYSSQRCRQKANTDRRPTDTAARVHTVKSTFRASGGEHHTSVQLLRQPLQDGKKKDNHRRSVTVSPQTQWHSRSDQLPPRAGTERVERATCSILHAPIIRVFPPRVAVPEVLIRRLIRRDEVCVEPLFGRRQSNRDRTRERSRPQDTRHAVLVRRSFGIAEQRDAGAVGEETAISAHRKASDKPDGEEDVAHASDGSRAVSDCVGHGRRARADTWTTEERTHAQWAEGVVDASLSSLPVRRLRGWLARLL